ncbi:MAG: hypothetical protein GWP56_14125 [Gammaproteobacteria bacterium]|nr:hypothetical protein [Gammaproteobacteria bacterium]
MAQALVPLQELTLKHLPAFSAAVALIGAIANRAAAAAARATPVVFLAVSIEYFLKLLNGCLYWLTPHYANLEETILQKVHKKP